MTQILKTAACMMASFALTALILHAMAEAPRPARQEPAAARHHSYFHPALRASGDSPTGNGSPGPRCVSGGERSFLVHDMRMWLHPDSDRECR